LWSLTLAVEEDDCMITGDALGVKLVTDEEAKADE
jgi:hypothetical protein